jgi:hypothetical protein
MHVTARLRRSLRDRGILGSLKHYAVRGYRIMRPHRLVPHPFDVEHGVHTTAYIEGSSLGTGHAHDLYVVCYYASPPSVVRLSIDAWRSTLSPSDPSLEGYTFFDIGAGMGRTVMVASLYPFERVVGIEMNHGLTEQARGNIDIWLRTHRACNQIELTTCDATEFPWPSRPLLIYLFNPFEAPVLMQLVRTLDQALTQGAGPIDLVYVHPTAKSVLEAHPNAQLRASTICYLSDADGAADLFSDPHGAAPCYECRIYRLSHVS